MKKFLSFVFVLIFTPIYYASAHVKWFVDSAEVSSLQHGNVPFYYLTSKEVLLWSIISVVVVVLFGYLDSWLKAPVKLLNFAQKHEAKLIRISQIILGLFLVIVTFAWNIVLVPELEISSKFLVFLATIQVLVGLGYIFNKFTKVFSVTLFGLYLATAFLTSPIALLENLILASLAVFFFIKSSSSAFSESLNKYSVEIVRIGTGVSLIILAFTEKLMYPELSLAFLEVHNWNFMKLLGLSWYSNELFVLSAGFAELIFGVLFILGYITRVTTALIALFFATSVVTMLIQFGAWEVEDLVVYSAAIILLFFGYGATKFFKSN